MLASNTSGIPITTLGAAVSDPGRVVGMHWSNPPHVIPVIEVIRGEKTSQEAVDLTWAMVEKIGMVPAEVKRDVAGFVENRILYAIMREALHLLDEGVASAEDIDKITKWGIGYKLAVIGPLELLDMAGLDIYTAVASYLNKDLSNDTGISSTVTSKVDEGKLGIKTQGGLFEYTPEQDPGAAAAPWPSAPRHQKGSPIIVTATLRFRRGGPACPSLPIAAVHAAGADLMSACLVKRRLLGNRVFRIVHLRCVRNAGKGGHSGPPLQMRGAVRDWPDWHRHGLSWPLMPIRRRMCRRRRSARSEAPSFEELNAAILTAPADASPVPLADARNRAGGRAGRFPNCRRGHARRAGTGRLLQRRGAAARLRTLHGCLPFPAL